MRNNKQCSVSGEQGAQCARLFLPQPKTPYILQAYHDWRAESVYASVYTSSRARTAQAKYKHLRPSPFHPHEAPMHTFEQALRPDLCSRVRTPQAPRPGPPQSPNSYILSKRSKVNFMSSRLHTHVPEPLDAAPPLTCPQAPPSFRPHKVPTHTSLSMHQEELHVFAPTYPRP